MQTVRKERIILKKLIKYSNKKQDTISFEALNIKDDFYPKELEKKRLVNIVGTGHEDDYGHFEHYNHLRLTEQGKHYFEHRHEDLKDQLLKSVYLPIAVSFITTCITLALNHWLPRLLGWK